jgi:hypothetical protein
MKGKAQTDGDKKFKKGYAKMGGEGRKKIKMQRQG